MECRIDTETEGSRTVIAVSGRLSGDSPDRLRRVLASIQGDIVVDVTDLVSTDDHGVDAIRTLRRAGVEIRGASPFLLLLLLRERPGEHPDHATPD